MSTATTVGVLQIVRSRLLTFTPATGSSLATLLGSTSTGAGSDGKLYLDQAPDDLTGFWAIMRLIDDAQQGMDGGFMHRFQIEVIVYGRGRAQSSAVNRMADVIEQAWLHWAYTEVGGHVSAHPATNRFTIPYAEPADRELVAVRLLLPGRCTPLFLSQYSA